MKNENRLGAAQFADDADAIQMRDLTSALLPRWKQIGAVAVTVGVLAYGVSLLIPPTFTARTTIISPQQQGSAASALASLGALAGLAGAGGSRTPADQYVALLQSVTLSDRIIDRFKLEALYETKFKEDARRALSRNVRVAAGKKDGLIQIEVDDVDPDRAKDMANTYVDELRRLSNGLALSEAQQRRMFFEAQLKATKNSLATAQADVQRTGFTAGALKSEPKAAAESYARIKAEIASTEVRLGALRRTMTETAPEVLQLSAALSGLRGQLAQFERPLDSSTNQDYVSAYREFKYQEALFEIYAKQFELARMDEAREGALIQVLDLAVKPERKSKPQRSIIALASALVGAVLACGVILVRTRRRHPQ